MEPRNNNQSLLLSLPKDVRVELISQFLNTSAILNLAKSSKQHFYSLFSEGPLYAYARSLLKKLLGNGALGELEDAEKIWKSSPDLLTCRGTVYHPNRIYVAGQPPVEIPFHQNPGRYKYNHTFYQILLMNSEFEEAEEVGKLMTQEEKQKQIAEIFPDGAIKKYDFDLQEAKKLLRALWDQIAKDDCLNIEYDEDDNIKNIIMSASTREALDKLYTYAKPKSEHEKGLVFDPEFYQEALKLYDVNCDQFKQKWDRYTFWNIRVEQWLACCLGTGFLRPLAQGPENRLHRRGCLLADGSSIFVFRGSINSIAAYHHFVGYFGCAERSGVALYHTVAGAWGWRVRSARRFFETYVKQKREQGQTLRGDIFEPKQRQHL